MHGGRRKIQRMGAGGPQNHNGTNVRVERMVWSHTVEALSMPFSPTQSETQRDPRLQRESYQQRIRHPRPKPLLPQPPPPPRLSSDFRYNWAAQDGPFSMELEAGCSTSASAALPPPSPAESEAPTDPRLKNPQYQQRLQQQQQPSVSNAGQPPPPPPSEFQPKRNWMDAKRECMDFLLRVEGLADSLNQEVVVRGRSKNKRKIKQKPRTKLHQDIDNIRRKLNYFYRHEEEFVHAMRVSAFSEYMDPRIDPNLPEGIKLQIQLLKKLYHEGLQALLDGPNKFKPSEPSPSVPAPQDWKTIARDVLRKIRQLCDGVIRRNEAAGRSKNSYSMFVNLLRNIRPISRQLNHGTYKNSDDFVLVLLQEVLIDFKDRVEKPYPNNWGEMLQLTRIYNQVPKTFADYKNAVALASLALAGPPTPLSSSLPPPPEPESTFKPPKTLARPEPESTFKPSKIPPPTEPLPRPRVFGPRVFGQPSRLPSEPGPSSIVPQLWKQPFLVLLTETIDIANFLNSELVMDHNGLSSYKRMATSALQRDLRLVLKHFSVYETPEDFCQDLQQALCEFSTWNPKWELYPKKMEIMRMYNIYHVEIPVLVAWYYQNTWN